MEFRILGPLEVVEHGNAVPLGGARQRALVAALLLRANEVVSTDQLLEDVWGERPPDTGVKALHVAISQLRKTVGADSNGRLTTRAPGYVLRVADDELDLHRFERLVAAGRSALEEGDVDAAAAALRDALAQWRGPAFADLAYAPFVQAEIGRLEEMRLSATEDLVDAELALGRHAAVVARLESLVAANPLRERVRAQLMLALYRCGRQAEALQVYQEGRRALDELGLEPAPALQQLERAILNQDGSLDAPAPVRPARAALPKRTTRPARVSGAKRATKRPTRRATALLVAGFGLAVVAIAAALVLVPNMSDSTQAFVTVPPNDVGVIDPTTNAIVDVVRVGGSPRAVTAGEGAVWVANSSFTISKLDPESHAVVWTVALAGAPVGIAATADGLWVTDAPGSILRYESTRGLLIDRIWTVRSDLPPETGSGRGIVVGEDESGSAVWALHGLPPTLVYVDPGGGSDGDYAVTRAHLPHPPTSAAFGERALWIVSAADDVVLRVTPKLEQTNGRRLNLEIDEITTGDGPAAVAVGLGAVWVANRRGDTVTRIQPWPLRVRTRIGVGDAPVGVAVGAGAVWVANAGDGTVSRIDPTTNRVTATIPIGSAARGVAVANGLVWVTAGRRAG